MLQYRIFIVGFGGNLYDAYHSESIPDNRFFDTTDEAGEYLSDINDGLKPHLTYVILPVYMVELKGV